MEQRDSGRIPKKDPGSEITTNYCFKHKYTFLLKKLLILLLKPHIKISRKNSTSW